MKSFMNNPSRRAVLYARVSTVDKTQNPETQLKPLREFAGHRGFAVVSELVDFASGTKDDRPQYQKLLQMVCKREADVVLV